jgi:hypothetical protein
MNQFQKGQKVITPDGEGYVEEIIGEDISVKLSNGEKREYKEDDLEDDADQG